MVSGRGRGGEQDMCGWVTGGEAFLGTSRNLRRDISATTENGEGQGRAQAMGGGGPGAPSTEDKRPGRFKHGLHASLADPDSS